MPKSIAQVARACSVFLAAAVTALGASADVSYSMTVLPRVPGTLATIGASLNASGDVVGLAYAQNMEQKAFMYAAGASRILPGMDAGRSRALGINDVGQAVGYQQDTTTGEMRAFVYSVSGGVTYLGNLGGPEAVAMGINNHGTVVGYSDVTPLYTGPYKAFVYDGTSTSAVPLTVPGATESFANAINSSGHIVGDVYTAQGFQAFLHVDGGTTVIGQLGGPRNSATAISDNDLVVGSSWLADGSAHAFLYNGTVLDLGTISDVGSLGYGLGTPAYSGASGVNSAGQVVGTFGYSGYQGRAFVYRDGSMMNLVDLVANPDGWVFTDAMDINEAGQILVYGYKVGEFVGTTLILTPTAAVPEPATWLMFGFGIWALSRGARAKSRPRS